MMCYQDGCEKEAIYIVYWPGAVPPPKYCREHAKVAVNLLAFLGTPTWFEEIKEKENDK